MALPVPIADLTLVELKKISKDLTLYPKKRGIRHHKVTPLTAFVNPVYIKHNGKIAECIMLPYRYCINNFKDKSIPPGDEGVPGSKFNFIKTENSDLRSEQVPVVEECLRQINEYSTSTLNVKTGFGKTICTFFISAKMAERTLILTSGNTINTGWFKAGKKHTDATIDIVANFSASKGLLFTLEECTSWLKDKTKNPTNSRKIKENGPTYNNMMLSCKHHGLSDEEIYGYNINSQILICMKDRYKYVPRNWPGLLVVDEADTFCCNTGIQAMLWFRPMYILLLTATYSREDKLHKILEYVADSHKIVRSLKVDYKVYKFETGFKPTRAYDNEGSLDWHIYQDSVINNHERIVQISEFIIKNASSHKILVLSSFTKIMDDLKDVLVNKDINCATLMKDQVKYKDSNVLLGTIGKLGRGFDEQNFCDNFNGVRINLLILTTTFQSKTLYVQTIGRVMRSSNPIVIHMTDDDTTAEKHWKKACTFYKKSGATIFD